MHGERDTIRDDLEATRLRKLRAEEKKAPKKLSWTQRCELLDVAGLGNVDKEALRKRFASQLSKH